MSRVPRRGDPLDLRAGERPRKSLRDRTKFRVLFADDKQHGTGVARELVVERRLRPGAHAP